MLTKDCPLCDDGAWALFQEEQLAFHVAIHHAVFRNARSAVVSECRLCGGSVAWGFPHWAEHLEHCSGLRSQLAAKRLREVAR